jgi:magnesium chelatase family protein
MLAVARTFAISGVEAVPVAAEVDIHRGLPAFSVVGLPDAAVRESRERVRAAIVNSGFDFPLQRITVSLAPSDLRKAGPGFDLAIAAAILVASSQIHPSILTGWTLAGELGLDGCVKPVRGALAMAERARRDAAPGIAVPESNAAEAALVPDVRVVPVSSLRALHDLADGADPGHFEPSLSMKPEEADSLPDLADLRGQPALRYALEVAAAGGHSLLIVGPPGAGKSLAARRLPSILPPLTHDEAIEVRRIAGVAGIAMPDDVIARRPFRAPHHTISPAGLIGGGSPPRPGEITLAHRGVLFLDELPEFARSSIESLRQPLEAGTVEIARASGRISLPCSFQLVAAANPCPCGRGSSSEACRCAPAQLDRYANRISGALADRIDLLVSVSQPEPGSLAGDLPEHSAEVRERVVAAREIQSLRFDGATNAAASDAALRREASLDAGALEALEQAQRVHGLSGRGWTRTLRLARTCADLAGAERVGLDHVAAALSLRSRSAP